MKAIVKIVLSLAVVVACFNAARAASNDFQFQDAVHAGLLFDSRASDEAIVEMVMKLASDYEIPLAAEDIDVRRVHSDLIVDMAYVSNVVLIPGIYAQDWTFTPSTSTRVLAGPGR